MYICMYVDNMYIHMYAVLSSGANDVYNRLECEIVLFYFGLSVGGRMTGMASA